MEGERGRKENRKCFSWTVVLENGKRGKRERQREKQMIVFLAGLRGGKGIDVGLLGEDEASNAKGMYRIATSFCFPPTFTTPSPFLVTKTW